MITLYHGSNVEIEVIDFSKSNEESQTVGR